MNATTADYITESEFVARITRHDNGNCCCGTCEPDWCSDCGRYVCNCPRRVSLYKSPFQRRDYANAGEPPF